MALMEVSARPTQMISYRSACASDHLVVMTYADARLARAMCHAQGGVGSDSYRDGEFSGNRGRS